MNMIEINLLPGQKKKRSGGGGITLPDFAELTQKIKDPLLAGAIGAIVVGLGAAGTIYYLEAGKLEALEPQVEALRRDNRRYQREIQLRAQEMALVDSLGRELERIRRIDADRYNWPHIMEEVARALPEYTWLESVEPIPQTTPPGFSAADAEEEAEADLVVEPLPSFQIFGQSSDIQYITRFYRRLAASPWFGTVSPGATASVIEENRTVYSFNVTVAFQRADSVFIETVPVLSSVQ